MRKDALQLTVSYKPIAAKKRFWLSSEGAYTDKELEFRRTIITLRTHSGIHPDYLANGNSWFADDNQAFVNINEHSWIFPDSYRPRQVLTMDDFHVQPMDSLRLQWPDIYTLMQNIGDYLIIRNTDLAIDHLNQPMNFVLLDLIQLFKGLAQNTNIPQLRTQLDLVNKYIRKIEKNLSAAVSSDKLFLADLRSILDHKIQPTIVQKIESQLLRERLADLSKTIKSLSDERNRILHFALNKGSVNPHAYEFSTDRNLDTSNYPTQIAKLCAHKTGAMVSDRSRALKLTARDIRGCTGLNLISDNEELLGQYATAISDLNELDRFQTVVAQITDLLNQAGEVYTIHQFKEQMLTLLKEIDVFLDSSSLPIQNILQVNTAAYHQAIQKEQELSLWKHYLTNQREELKQFIKNQDNLELVPSRPSDLLSTVQQLKENVAQVVAHLNKPKIAETNFQSIAGQAQELNQLMLSMHFWIKHQRELKGLDAPKIPEPLLLKVDTTIQPVTPLLPPPISLYTNQNNHLFFAEDNPHELRLPHVENASTDMSNQMLFILGGITFPLGIVAVYLIYRGLKAVLKEKEPEVNQQANCLLID